MHKLSMFTNELDCLMLFQNFTADEYTTAGQCNALPHVFSNLSKLTTAGQCNTFAHTFPHISNIEMLLMVCNYICCMYI